MKTFIVLIPTDAMSDGRKVLERIENSTYKSIEEVQNAICFDEHDPIATEDIGIIPISDFMDGWNDCDDTTIEQNWSNIIKPENISNYWFGYISVKM